MDCSGREALNLMDQTSVARWQVLGTLDLYVLEVNNRVSMRK